MYFIQHCFICRPSDSTVSEDAGIEPRIVVTLALSVRHSNPSARSHLHAARSHPLSARSHPHSAISYPHSAIQILFSLGFISTSLGKISSSLGQISHSARSHPVFARSDLDLVLLFLSSLDFVLTRHSARSHPHLATLCQILSSLGWISSSLDYKQI